MSKLKYPIRCIAAGISDKAVGLKFETLEHAVKWSGIPARVIVACIQGKIKHDGRYKWKRN